MSEAEILQKLLITVAALAGLAGIQNVLQFATLLTLMRGTKKKKQQRLSCAHCCSELDADNPTNGYALPDSTLIVYKCSSCGRETAIKSTV